MIHKMRGVGVAFAVPVIFALGVRLLMMTFLQSENRNGDNFLKGLIQGILIYHAILSANQAINVALFLGICGRLVGDFATRRDGWRAASTLLGIAFGIVMADVASHLYGDTQWTAIQVLDDISDDRSVDGSSHGSRRRRRISEPRRIEELPTVYEELSSIDSHSLVEDNQVHSDAEKEVARLRAKALHAAGQRRRFREERKWAWSQGNFARALQLRWQVKKYQALAESFTREADQKLIEADRAKRNPPIPRPEERHYRPEHEPAPFVQVIVERGFYDRDLSDENGVESGPSGEPNHKADLKTTSRVTKAEVTKVLKSGVVQVDSRGHLSRCQQTKDASISMDPTDLSPASSNTWSRQLD